MEKKENTTSRRKYLEIAGGAVVGLAVGAAAGYSLPREAPVSPGVTSTVTTTVTSTVTGTETTKAYVKPKGPLSWYGPNWLIREDLIEQLKKEFTELDLKIEIGEQTDILQKLMVTGTEGYDLLSSSTYIYPGFQQADLVGPVDVTRLAHWDPKNIADQFLRPENVCKPFGAMALSKNLWWDRDKGLMSMVPCVYNWDGMSYDPRYAPKLWKRGNKGSWGDMYNREYKGHTGFLGIPEVLYAYVAEWLVASKQMPFPKAGEDAMFELAPDEVDILISFLIDEKKAGQFRTMYTGTGEAVDLHTKGELWISDLIAPSVEEVKHAGVPCHMAVPDEGYRVWYGGDFPAKAMKNEEAAYGVMDWHMSTPWFARHIANYGYYVPYLWSKEIENYMGPELYGFLYLGKPTYKAVPEDQKHIFTLDKYDWSMEPGTPNYKDGCYRDKGSIVECMKNINHVEWHPSNIDYYYKKWDEFMKA